MAENFNTAELAVSDGETSVREKETKKNKSRKLTVVITYVFALLCLLAGLLVPLYMLMPGMKVSESNMMLAFLPYMVNCVFAPVKKTGLIPIKGKFFVGAGLTQYSFSFAALMVVLYAILCVIALFMLIPVCAGNKEKRGYVSGALAIEILSLIVSSLYIAYVLYTFFSSALTALVFTWTDYNFLIAFGGVMLATIVQSVATKGGIGVSKTIAIILSVLGAIALFDITVFIPKLADGLNKLSGSLKSGEYANFIGGILLPSIKGLGSDGFVTLINIKDFYKFIFEQSWSSIVCYILLMLIAVLMAVNVISDLIGLGTGKKFNKDRSPARNSASNTFALVRYIITFIFVLALIIIAIVVKGLSAGVYLYLLAAVLLLQIINASVRTAVANKRANAGQYAPSYEERTQMYINDPAFTNQGYTEQQPAYQQPVYQQPVYQQPEEAVAETPAEPAVEEVTPVYEETYEPEVAAEPEQLPLFEEQKPVEQQQPTTVYVYGGDTDEFMDTLTDAEKIEFVEVFIKKSKGIVNGVPSYRINEDNTDFFPAVFIHINRYRNMASDALLGKLYRQLGKSL